MKKQVTSAIFAVLSLALLLCLVSCGAAKPADELWKDAIYTADTEIGEGDTSFPVEISVGEHKITLSVHTNEATVGAALQKLGIIDGDEGQFGLYIKKVNGITADYDVDQSYWSFFENSTLAPTGADLTEIKIGVTYRFEYTK